MLHHSASASAKPEEQLPDEERPQRKDIVSFGPFRLFATQRLLEKDGVPLNLGSRALDLLIALVERATEVVSKRELMARVWPDLVVDEGSLRFHIASLRKVLGDGQSGVRYVTNVAGRGYCFVAPISRSAAKPPRAESFAADQAAKLPSRLLRMVGRDETVQTISAQLLGQRFVTVVGPGGIGKTTVAVSVAHAEFAEFGGAVHFVDRHQTLGATLDWSHNLLSEFERVVLRRLAVFVGTFSLEAARSVAAETPIERGQVVEAVASLVAKSLVATEVGPKTVRCRLLDTTRTYALDKLVRSGEAAAVALRHATYYRELFELTDSAASRLSKPKGSAVHREHVSNIRAALEWSFSAQGDLDLGTALAAASAPLFLEMSLLSECRVWMERSIAARDAVPWDPRREMEIQAALALSLMFTGGDCEEVRAALLNGLALADELKYPSLQMRLLGALHIFLTRIGDFHGALALARRSEAVAKTIRDPAATLVANWMLGISYHFIGTHGAREHCEAVLHPQASRDADLIHCHRIRTLVTLARTLWIQGYADRAAKFARQSLDEAGTLTHPVRLCIVLIYAAPVLLWIGDWPTAEATIERLIAHAGRHSLAPYHAFGIGLKGELSLRRGDLNAGILLLRTCLDTLPADTVFTGDLAEGLAMAGQIDEAIAVINEAIGHSERNGGSFHTPEILRIKGELLASAPGATLSEAEDWLSRSLQLARRQSALAWELRTAMSLALLRRKQGRHDEGHGALAAVYDRFTEGFETSDLRAARRLLDELEQPASAPRIHATSIPKLAQGVARIATMT